MLEIFPAVALLGPRQVGKTTLAESLQYDKPQIYLDLESQQDLKKLSDPELYLAQHQDELIILDEVQRIPQLFQSLRGLIDQGKRQGIKSGRFLLLSSASIDLLSQSGESLAGRIAYLELTPLDILDVDESDLNKLWLQGGFPDSFLAKNDKSSFIWRQNFIRTYLERDIPALGPKIPAVTLQRFWTMLAHNQGCLHNGAQLARSLAVDGKTVARYLDLLVDLLLVRRLMPYHNNVKKRLVKSPKIYVRDSGLTHGLLNIHTMEQLYGHPIIGQSWEGFVIESIINAAPENTQASFYRTSAGAEIDLLLELPNSELWAIEIKRGLSPSISKGFHHAIDDIKPSRNFIVYSGDEQYPIKPHIEVIPLLKIAQLLQAV